MIMGIWRGNPVYLKETGWVELQCTEGAEQEFIMYQIILASGSPRRKEILEQVGAVFAVIVSEKEENPVNTLPEEAVKELSLMKAVDVAGTVSENTVVIGADTVVAYQGQILGKPRDREDAFRMLSLLQGREHQVYTGVAILIKRSGREEERIQFYEKTDVSVASMDQEQIDSYIATGEPMDKAGAYGIQGRFAVHVREIKGDYYNVVGLPVHAVYGALKEAGINLAGQEV